MPFHTWFWPLIGYCIWKFSHLWRIREACNEPMEGRHRTKGNCGDNRPRSPTKSIGFPPNSIRSWAEIERKVMEARFTAYGVNIGTSSVMIKSAAMI
jgi:hypothetical protein